MGWITVGVLNYKIDIHGMTVPEAKKLLEKTIMSLPNKYGQVTVIHGYQNGSRLQSMVRGKGFACKRVKQKILTLNQGETILILRDRLD
jgi:dsDNA-specific endonuclease/ATPase MutS2